LIVIAAINAAALKENNLVFMKHLQLFL